MTPELEAIRVRERAASPGPWEFEEEGGISTETGGMVAFVQPHGNVNTIMREGETYCRADGEFIAHARTDIPLMLSHIDTLTARIVELEADRHNDITRACKERTEESKEFCRQLFKLCRSKVADDKWLSMMAIERIQELEAEVERLRQYADPTVRGKEF